MGVLAQKISVRHTGMLERLAGMYFRAVRVFMDYADVGFRYIDIPVEDDLNRPTKKRAADVQKTEYWLPGLKPCLQN